MYTYAETRAFGGVTGFLLRRANSKHIILQELDEDHMVDFAGRHTTARNARISSFEASWKTGRRFHRRSEGSAFLAPVLTPIEFALALNPFVNHDESLVVPHVRQPVLVGPAPNSFHGVFDVDVPEPPPLPPPVQPNASPAQASAVGSGSSSSLAAAMSVFENDMAMADPSASRPRGYNIDGVEYVPISESALKLLFGDSQVDSRTSHSLKYHLRNLLRTGDQRAAALDNPLGAAFVPLQAHFQQHFGIRTPPNSLLFQWPIVQLAFGKLRSSRYAPCSSGPAAPSSSSSGSAAVSGVARAITNQSLHASSSAATSSAASSGQYSTNTIMEKQFEQLKEAKAIVLNQLSETRDPQELRRLENVLSQYEAQIVVFEDM